MAHVLSSLSGISKGGGGKQPQSFSEYDPSKAADVLKDRFVDRNVVLGVDLKTGTAGYATPSLLSVGAGQAPYKLDYAVTFKAAPTGCAGAFGPCTGPVEGGWNQSWDVRFTTTGSGLEAMGATSPLEAAGTLVAFMAMQDIFQQTSPALPDLNKDVFAALVADWWRQQMIANVATVNRGFSGAQYVRLVDGTFMPPVGSPGILTQTNQRVKVRDQCQTVPSNAYAYSTSRRWDSVGPNVHYSLKSAGGDVIGFQPWAWSYNPDDGCAIAYGYEPNTWTWPQGPSITFTSDPQQGVTAISTSLGRSMTFTGAHGSGILGNPLTAKANGITVGQQVNGSGAITGTVDANGNEIWNFTYDTPVARSASQRPVPYPRLFQVFEPVSAFFPALQYTYDTRGLVETASDATSLQWGQRGPYSWFLALGARGERDDPSTPTPGAYTVYYSTDGDPVRDIDEIGREVDSVFDGRHRVTRRTFPEGDQELFAYDTTASVGTLDDVVSLTKVPKPGSGLSNIVIQAGYDPTWNKLAWIRDPMGNETDFSYYPSGSGASLMSQAQRPAVGGIRPTFSYQYNSIGLLTQSVDPTGVTTQHGYDGYGNLTSTAEGAAAVGANPALNLTTTFTPDGFGNITAVVDPRGDATTTQYDNMRRRSGEQNRNGGVTALPIKAKAFGYD
ncbi:MAG: RHS repeat domain-containing protein, partial [Caulobacteraceae bacterium]